MFKILQRVLSVIGRIFGRNGLSDQKTMTYREFRSGKRKLRYKIIKDQRATNRYEQDQSNAVIVLPDFEAAQHEDILHTSLEELGQQLNIDSFSVYQDDAALAFNSKSNELTEEEQRQFRESFIGVYPGRRRS